MTCPLWSSGTLSRGSHSRNLVRFPPQQDLLDIPNGQIVIKRCVVDVDFAERCLDVVHGEPVNRVCDDLGQL